MHIGQSIVDGLQTRRTRISGKRHLHGALPREDQQPIAFRWSVVSTRTSMCPADQSRGLVIRHPSDVAPAGSHLPKMLGHGVVDPIVRIAEHLDGRVIVSRSSGSKVPPTT
jgi:hypothetical protein